MKNRAPFGGHMGLGRPDALSSDMPNDNVTSWLEATECNVGNFVGSHPANYNNWCFQSTVLLVE
jgi:hypothetical protein